MSSIVAQAPFPRKCLAATIGCAILARLKVTADTTRLAAFDLASAVGWATIGAAVIAALGIIVALATLIAQGRQVRFSATLDSLWRFDDQLHGQEMRGIRLAAAKALKQRKDIPEIVDVLNFFEMLGLIFRKGGIDKDAALSNFGYWVRGYWYACRDRIASDRKKDPTAWEEYERLKTALEEMDAKRSRKFRAVYPSTAGPMWAEEIKEFLNDELKLKV